jgi:predicted TIM-barrel fold metal-dependent hydrolase
VAIVVDVHCHTFNADDLPVQGFVRHVAFGDRKLANTLAALLDRLVQGKAPGFAEESVRLDALLAGTDQLGQESLTASLADVDADLEVVVAALLQSDPELAQRLAEEMPGGPPSGEQAVDLLGQEGLADSWEAIRRAARWATLFGSFRLDITAHLAATFDNSVDLFTPMLVDLSMGLDDVEKTTFRQQVVLQEKISRLSMLGRLPNSDRARVHPFIGFDPRRVLKARRAGDIETPLDLLRLAVERYGFIGVKLYPPMGFRPLDNVETRSDSGRILISAAEAEKINGVLRELYKWCVAEHVPVTAHCNASNGARSEYRTFSHPDYWAAVLREFPELHLNLGHFGGTSPESDWPELIGALAKHDNHLYADVGHHRIDLEEPAQAYMDRLCQIFNKSTDMADRVLYGSDWLMLAILPEHELFRSHYEQLYSKAFGKMAAEGFMGARALRFLGFDDPANKNRQRLRKRYERFAPGAIPDWLA